ncbi:MAG: protease pro-enzyme activation domain-containing protein [Thermoplasmata archaeon]
MNEKFLFFVSVGLILMYLLSFSANAIPINYPSNKTLLIAVPFSYDEYLLNHSVAVGVPSLNTTVWISFTLKFSNESSLNSLLANLNNPKSSEYRKFLTQQQFIKDFSPPSDVYYGLVEYLESKGLHIEYTWKDRVTVTVEDSMENVENALHVKFQEYKTTINGFNEIFWSVNGPIYLPSTFVPYIRGIDGTNNATRYTMNMQIQGKINPNFIANGVFPYVYSSDLQKAYDTIELYNNSASAAPSTNHIFAFGRTIATILWEGTTLTGSQVAPFNPADVFYYYDHNMPLWERNDNGIPHIWGIGTSGTVPPGSSAEKDYYNVYVENTLDLEFSGMQAPGCNVINVYGPGSSGGPSESNFPDNEYNIAVNIANLTAVSNSWGTSGSGSDVQSSSTVQADVQEMEARGITVLASSGDNGDTTTMGNPANDALNTYGFVAVGGLTIGLNGNPSNDGTGTNVTHPLSYETVWYDNKNTSSSGYHYGTESGTSTAYPMPSWQDIPAVTNNGGSTAGRDIADVSAIANNSVIYLGSGTSNAGYYSVGGTSVACPVVAGQITEIDAYIGVFYNQPWGLGFVDPLFYEIGPNNAKYTSPPFFDVTTYPVNYHNPAKVGWDYGSGWGSLNSWNFTMALKFFIDTNVSTVSLKVGSTAYVKVSTWYPTLYNSSVYLTVKDIPSGISATLNTNVTSPAPNNASAGTATLTLYEHTNAKAGKYVIYITGTNYNPSTKSSGNLTGEQSLVLYVSNVWYNATFSETGLPANLKWNIDFNGTYYSSNTPTIKIPVYNGTYYYNINNSSYYTPTPYKGNVVIKGSNVTIPVTFNHTYNVTFIESGLPYGFTWGIKLNSTLNKGTSSSIVFTVKNGSYTYSIMPLGGYYPNVSYSGNVNVNGKNLSLFIKWYVFKYNVTFKETGLPVNDNWSIKINNTLKYTTKNTIVYQLPNGTYQYFVYAPRNYISLSYSTFSLNGGSVYINVNFNESFWVKFYQSGLPIGTNWSMDINNRLMYTTGNNITFNTINGSMDYTINSLYRFIPSPQKGSIKINGSNITMNIVFNETFSITFTEHGLVSNVTWGVNIGNVVSSNTSTVTFNLINGTYRYSIVPLAGYDAIPSQGTVSVKGTNSTVSIVFYTLYNIIFEESGLPVGTLWHVTVNNVMESSSTSIITFSEINGTYMYNVTPVPFYNVTPSNAQIKVNGASQYISINFVRLYSITFYETGLKPTTSWSISLSNIIKNSTSSTITFWEEQGDYQFTVLSVPGFVSNVTAGYVNVYNSNITENISWSLEHYVVVFIIKGLPSNFSWGVYFNNSKYTTVSYEITVSVMAGIYNYSIMPINGYYIAPQKGIIKITDNSTPYITIQINATRISNNNAAGISSSSFLAPVIIIIIAVIVIVLLVVLKRRKKVDSKIESKNQQNKT